MKELLSIRDSLTAPAPFKCSLDLVTECSENQQPQDYLGAC